jgi:hypothetical protein
MRFTSQTCRHHHETLDQPPARPAHPDKSAVQAATSRVSLDVRRHRDQGNPQAFLIRGGHCGFPAGTQPRKSPDAQPSAGFVTWIGQRAAARSAFRLCLDRADLCTAIRNLEGAPPLCEALRQGWGAAASEQLVNVDHFIHGPVAAVTALLPDWQSVESALGDLQSAGFDAEHARILLGEEGARILDIMGTEH